MIIQLLLSLVFGILKLLFGWLELPSLPDDAMNAIKVVGSFLAGAVSFLSMFFDFSFFVTLFVLYELVAHANQLYDLGVWIIKKIPFLGIDMD